MKTSRIFKTILITVLSLLGCIQVLSVSAQTATPSSEAVGCYPDCAKLLKQMDSDSTIDVMVELKYSGRLVHPERRDLAIYDNAIKSLQISQASLLEELDKERVKVLYDYKGTTAFVSLRVDKSNLERILKSKWAVIVINSPEDVDLTSLSKLAICLSNCAKAFEMIGFQSNKTFAFAGEVRVDTIFDVNNMQQTGLKIIQEAKLVMPKLVDFMRGYNFKLENQDPPVIIFRVDSDALVRLIASPYIYYFVTPDPRDVIKITPLP